MLILWIFVFTAAVWWSCYWVKDDKESGVAAIVVLLGIISTIATFVGVVVWVTNVSNVSQELQEYKTVKWQAGKVDKIHVNDVPLIQQAMRWNDTIQRHKIYKDSKWVGIWYSKEIAELEPIKFPD